MNNLCVIFLAMITISTSFKFVCKTRLYSLLNEVQSVDNIEKRISAGSETLDTQYVTDHFDTVLSHLKSRKSSTQLIDDVTKIPKLRVRRNTLILQRDTALNMRKTVSQQIGFLIKNGKDAEVLELKKAVEQANIASDLAAKELEEVDNDIDVILKSTPNLIDDR